MAHGQSCLRVGQFPIRIPMTSLFSEIPVHPGIEKLSSCFTLKTERLPENLTVT